MPYDHSRAHELRRTALAYQHTVYGDILGEMAQCLIDAEAEIKALTVGTVDTRAETEEANRRLMNEAQAHRQTKEKLTAEIQALTTQKQEMFATLTDISLDARGAKQRAADLLLKLAMVPEVKP